MKSKSAHLARLVRFLVRDIDFTHSDLVEYTGIHRDTAERLMRELRKEGPGKMYRVVDWRMDSNGRMSTMVFGRGAGADAPKPPPRPAAERQAQYAARKTARTIGRAFLSANAAGNTGSPSSGDADAPRQRRRVGAA